MTEKKRPVAYIHPELEDIIPLFYEHSRKEIAEMRNALANKDYETLRLLGHSVKGASPSYGFEALGEMGLAVETAAKEKKGSEEISVLIDNIADYLDTVEIIFK